ncbi:putative nicotinamide mononucleotide permease [Leucosporidium creatinivorum]|uniref:Putative nicotinamide mononucleotide permease n=1 Tax=Leucosporidium creatinivorum TaxID=106004 RepID=A0A1Y2D6V2_9BASI|nr:putative nicotinamide mononucleotide permease [Leucosporidium creatinivorum]
MSSDSKPIVAHIESTAGIQPEQVGEIQQEIDKLMLLTEDEFKAEEKKLLRKIDSTLLPTLFLLLILNYLDRNALASARVQGIEADLGMAGTNFNTAVSVLFVGYILGQVPSNMILARSRPSIYLSICVFVWGMVSLCTGFVKNYEQLLAVRVLLGVAESPYFGGALFLLSTWYTKRELAFRTAFLYSGSLLSGAFSGFISAGIQKGLDGAHGLESWRWLFIIEGAITAFVALLAILILPDYPATTRWLSTREKALAVYRLEKDVGSKDEDNVHFLTSLKMALTDYRLYLLAVIIITKTTAGAVTQFFPTVVQTFGFSKEITLLLTAPPYLVTTVLSIIISRMSDRKPERCFHLAIPLAIGMIGFIISAATTKTAPRYFSLFLMLGGLFGSYNIALAWISSSFPRPRSKRAVAYATINSLGNIAQIWSPYLYPKSDGPKYSTAFITNSVMTAASIAFCLILRYCLKRNNEQMDRQEQEDLETASRLDKDSAGAPAVQKQIRYVL